MRQPSTPLCLSSSRKVSTVNPVRHGRIDLRRVTDNDWRLWRRLRLAALEEAPYAFSQKLSDWTGTGDTERRWRARLTSVPFNGVAYLDALEVGIVSGARPKGPTGQLVSMWVTPSARGKGVGTLWSMPASIGREPPAPMAFIWMSSRTMSTPFASTGATASSIVAGTHRSRMTIMNALSGAWSCSLPRPHSLARVTGLIKMAAGRLLVDLTCRAEGSSIGPAAFGSRT